jgi:superfamily II DNA helicase RecQ
MSRFLDDKGCRQLALLRHFGDVDGKGACGICDACDPTACRLRQSRAVTDAEGALVRALEARLRTAGARGISTGKLYSESLEKNGVDRRSFEHLLAALVRAGRVEVEERSFDNERGERIRYQNATLTTKPDGDLSLFVSAREGSSSSSPSRRARGTSRGAPSRAPRSKARPDVRSAAADDDLVDESALGLVAKLKAWRLSEAQARKAPAFTICGDRVLMAIAAAQPSTLDELSALAGVGPRFLRTFGRAVLDIVAED